MPAFLADSSVWIGAERGDRLAAKLAQRADAGDVRMCVPVALEILHGPADGPAYDALVDGLETLDWLPLTDRISRRALEVQQRLAHTTAGAHRIPAVDFLVAAIAEEGGAVLWHADRDLRRICELTGQPQEHERVR